MDQDRHAQADRRLAAAHARLDRECQRNVASPGVEDVVLSVEGGALIYHDAGEARPVTWFDLLTYGESLNRRGILSVYHAAYPKLSFPIGDAVRAAFGSGVLLEVPPYTTDPLPGHDLEPVREAASTAASSDVAPEAVNEGFPAMNEIVRAVLVALSQADATLTELLEGAGTVLRYPLASAHAKEIETGGVAVKRSMDRMFALLTRLEVVRRENKTFSLTDTGRETLANGDLSALVCEPIMDSDRVANPPKQKKQKASSLGRRSHDELVSMWKNAVRMLADPSKRKDHARAKAVIDEIGREWDARAKTEDGYFKWPSTEARGGNGRLGGFEAEKEGMLSFLEYRVGRTRGEPHGVRKVILRRVFEGPLPPVFSRAYMAEWGANGSPERLHKMAVSLAAFARNFKRRRTPSVADAVKDWESDLEYLRTTFYVGKFGFGWPATAV